MARSKDAHIRVQGLQPVQVLAGLVGLVYLAAGIVGFARTGLGDFAGHQHVMLLGFMINPLHNLVHVVVGVLGLLTATYSGLSRAFGWVLFIGYGLLAIWGLMITGVFSSNPVSNLGNPLNINDADNWLHIGSAVLGLIIAIMPARKIAAVVEPEPAATTAKTEPIPAGAHAETTRTDAVNAPEGARSPEARGARRPSWLRRRSHTPAH
jgi:hypothetical protein